MNEAIMTTITDEQMTAGAAVLAGYNNLHLNWRNAAIDVFEAMTAAAPVAELAAAKRHTFASIANDLIGKHRDDSATEYVTLADAEGAVRAAQVAPLGEPVEQWRLKGSDGPWYDVTAKDKDALLGFHHGYERRIIHLAATAPTEQAGGAA